MICSNQRLLKRVTKNVFHKKNGYPLRMINQVIETVEETIITENISTNQLEILEANNDKSHSLILPFAGTKGNNIIKPMNNNIQQILLNNFKIRITYTGKNLMQSFR